MATENSNETPETKNEQLLAWMSALGGAGIVAIVVALGLGVVNPQADSSAIGIAVLFGFALLVTAIGGWVVIEQPHKDFDDINVPQYHGHHGHADEHHDDETHDTPQTEAVH